MTGQILSISSHVVHGYVGNRAITFPLQYIGWNVDALNTTNLSNHPGYGKFSGQVEDAELIGKILDGLNSIHNGLDKYEMIITGYLPNVEILKTVEKLVFDPLSGKSPMIIMDPILGDNGKLYISEQVVPIYKNILSSGKVHLITPNQFEFEYFSGVPITDIDSLKTSIGKFNQLYKVENIIISSINIDDKMYCVGATGNQIYLVPILEIPCKFFGCGDLFTALVANNFFKHKVLNEKLLIDSTFKLSKVLQHTYELAGSPKVINDINIIGSKHLFLEDFSDQPIDFRMMALE